MKPSFMFRNGICLGCLLVHFSHESLQAANITWIGGNVDWVDNSGNANWSPADEPDFDDVAIFTTANSVNLGSNNTILGLTLSGNVDIKTNSYDLTVDGLVLLSGTGTTFTIGGSASQVVADSVTINSAGSVIMDQGSLVIIEETGSGVLDINTGASLTGRGTVSLNDALASPTTSIVNDGTIAASTVGLILIGNPAAGTLSINTIDTDARIDLDGTSGNGILNVFRNQTLDLNVTVTDAFSGDINLYHNSVLDIADPWSMDGLSTLDVKSGFAAGTPPFIPDTPASTSFVRGGDFSQTGGTITNIDSDGTLQFDAPFTLTSGDLVNNGIVVFNANSLITAGANFTMTTGTSSITVNDGVEVNIDQANFNADGNGLVTNLLTVGSGGILDLDLGAGADATIGSSVFLNGGELDVTSTTGTWELNRSVTTGASTGASAINGNPVTFSGITTVGNGSTLTVNANPTFPTGSSSVVNGLFSLGFNTILSGGAFSGSGTLRLASTSTVSANTTINTTEFDWDGLGVGTLHTVSDGAVLTINSTTFDSDGDMDDPVSLGGNSATIAVNGVTEWTANNTFTTNPGAVGTALINGTARLILAGTTSGLLVQGNTTINAPVTFGTSSATTVDAARTLRSSSGTVFDGGSIGGTGTYIPGGTVSVLSSSSINVATADLDSANWIIESGATLTVSVTDYDTVAANALNSTMTLNNGRVSMNTADAEFVMDGILNMNDGAGPTTEWSGEPLDIGDDDSSILGRLNVLGTSQSSIFSQIDFNSDARVNIAAGSTLNLVNTANFDTVNGLDNATFTGAGVLSFTGAANFNEAATFDMSGGSIDLDGSDATGSTISVSAPVVMNLGTLQSFGKVNGSGTNILLVDRLTGTGSLTVNLDNPGDEWTLNTPGALVLVSTNAANTLLSGSPANLNGTVSVTGDVRTSARLDIGGTVNILTAGEPLRLNGGDLSTTNTLVGGTINGPGLLGADSGAALAGFGTIAANVDFDGSADLFADNGILNVTGSIVDARNVGSRDTDGIFNVVNPWNSSVVNSIGLNGGEVRGGTITLDNTFGITGIGLVSARVINNTRISTAGSGTLVVQTATNDNDWDGTGNIGNLIGNFGTLELRDDANFTFGGTITAQSGGTVFANGFALNPNAGSSINLTNGHFRSTASTTFSGPIFVAAGGASSLEVQSPNLLDLTSGVGVNMTGNLSLVTTNGRIRSGAVFGGGGALVIPSASVINPDAGADIGVLIANSGTLRIAGASVGRNDAQDYQQNASGTLEIGMTGTGLTQYDRLVVNGAAQLAGTLDLRLSGFVPTLGNTFGIVSATSGVTGTFGSVIQPAGMPAGLAFQVNYLPTLIQIEVVNSSPYDTWINSFPGLVNPADRLKPANPDGDALNNLGEFALDGDPSSGANSGKIFGKIAPVGGVDAMTLTLAVRSGALPAVGDPPGGELVLEQTTDSLTYSIQATDELTAFTLNVTEVLGADATAIQSGLPAVNVGWDYRTFRSPGPVVGDPEEFMRVFIHD